MQKNELAPLAAHLTAAYLDTSAFSRQFRDEHKTPPTHMAKVHHMLSVVLARTIADDRYEVKLAYAEFGRLHLVDSETGQQLLLRSAGTVAIEQVRRYSQPSLFPDVQLTGRLSVDMVIYEFSRKGIDLSVARTQRRPPSTRLLAASEPTWVGHWEWSSEPETAAFNQSGADAFTEVGALVQDDAETTE